jgi:hypothetical protein
MDRRLSHGLAFGFAALGLGILVVAPGCRSTRSEVPPGKPYSTTGATPGSVGFNSDPRTSASNGGGIYGNNPLAPGQNSNALGVGSASAPMGGMSGSSSATSEYGTPAPTQGLYGAPTSNKYGTIPTMPLSPTPGGGN